MNATLQEPSTGVLMEPDAQVTREPEPRSVARMESEPLDESTVLLQVIARAAQDSSIDLDRMERLMEMQERLSAKRAEREFVDAMARFQQDAPKIIKDKRVYFESKNGGATTDYRHATLGAVCEAVLSGLGRVGISVSWVPEQKDARVHVTCVLTHRGGHSTRTSLNGPPDVSGNKNPMQQVSSTITLLERYTLLAATGLGTHDQDDDGSKGGETQNRHESAAPEGYEKWKADMTAVADEGIARLQDVWAAKDSGKFRGYAVTLDSGWWNTTKAKASKVKVAS